MSKKILYGLLALFFSTLACEPVIAIGWKEMFFVFLFAAILFGPPLYKFIRRLEKFLKHEKQNK